jgi:hypothetical protein
VGVTGGQADRQRDAGGVADQVVLAARSGTVDRACAGRVPVDGAHLRGVDYRWDQSSWSPRRRSASSS